MNVKLAGKDRLIGAHSMDYWKTPLFHRADGRPVFPIGGASPDDDSNDDDTDDGDDDGGDDGDDLDSEIDDALGEGGDDGDGDGEELTDSEKRLLAKLDKSLGEKMTKGIDRIADRLVNAEATRARKAAQSRRNNSGGGSGNGKSGGDKQETAVDHSADIREARAIYREFVPDEYKFTSNDERDAALVIATSYVEQEVRGGANPDTAGKAAAELVAKTFKSVRKSARSQLLAELAKSGRLVKKDGAGGAGGGGLGRQPNRAGTGRTASTDMQKGAEAAARVRPKRVESTQ